MDGLTSEEKKVACREQDSSRPLISSNCSSVASCRHPELEKEGKNPFTLDSKEPNWDEFENFLKGEVRYASVMKQYPEEAEQLFAAAKENAQWRYNNYRRLARQQWGVEPEE